jgi:hypothetical protein
MGLSPYTGHAQEMEQPYDWHRQRAGYREGSGNATFYLESRQAAWGVADSRSWICFRPKLATGPTVNALGSRRSPKRAPAFAPFFKPELSRDLIRGEPVLRLELTREK